MKTSMIAKSTAFAALALLAVSCGGGGNTPASTDNAEEKKVLVKIAAATTESVAQTEEFSGTILPFTQNNISPSMGLRIGKILTDVGDRVSRGQVLVELDRSTLLQAQVQLENLKTDLQRYESLYQEGGISKQRLDQIATQVNAAQVSYDNLLENTVLRSPVTGIVTERNYDPGDLYSMGRAIMTVVQIDRVKVQINISEAYFPQVKEGMPVEVKLDVYPGESFEGKVSLVHPSVNAATRTFTTEITIPNGNQKLRPGMFCRVAVNFGQEEQVVVPGVAVQKQAGTNERFGFVVENGVARRRVLETGRQIGNSVVILSGVEAGENIVTAGGQKLLDGTEVETTRE